MTITSFDNGMPHSFYHEKTLQGRLKIFMRHVACKVMRKDLINRDLEKVSILLSVDDATHAELYYDQSLMGYIQLIPATKDFIFKQ